MQYGFVIDNRKCIGCHACTVACKSEHDVAIGVNRTFVKQVEKGEYPNTRRVFSVMRCNHCSDAPCVNICPTSALFTRDDGIVDFDNNRCIGCKSCMQACPYDALYIDPDTNTAAKCNYCAHRVDVGLEPSCVNICPEEAIISGDMDDPNSKIAQLLSREQVTVRRPEKATYPNLFYINGDEASLNPSVTERSDNYIWGSQTTGVGHFSKFAESLANGKDLLSMVKEQTNYKSKSAETTYSQEEADAVTRGETQVEGIMKNMKTKRVYDTPDKGILWGWEVSAYLWTKSISAGIILISLIWWLLHPTAMSNELWLWTASVSMVFLILTGIFLVKDLDQPKRFIFVLLRPQFSSWLVKGGYSIAIFGAALAGIILGSYFEWDAVLHISIWAAGVMSIIVAVYTAFLFAQAKGRDFWQSPTLALHMFVHSLLTGSSVFALMVYLFAEITNPRTSVVTDLFYGTNVLLLVSLIAAGVILLVEMMTTHPTQDSKRAVAMILKGRYKNRFWFGAVLIGLVIPLGLTFFFSYQNVMIASVLILIGSYITEKIWVEAPQRIPLT